MREIHETRATCKACGHVWHYGKQDELISAAENMENVGKDMMCCGGCLPALLIPDKKPVDYGKCPNCGSSAVSTEQVTYEVE